MLSYKYYKDSKNNGINIPRPILVINQIFKDEFKKDWLNTIDNLENPHTTFSNKNNIWDILAENALVILNDALMSQYDKLYLVKLLCELREQTYIAPGVEYYCLREIIRLTPFSFKNNIKWIAKIMANRIKELLTYHYTKKQLMILTRNYRKIEIIKRIYKTSVIWRTHWKLVYDCWTIGDNIYKEVLNKTEILKYLNIGQTINNIDSINDKKESIELETIEKILDEELLKDSQDFGLIGLEEIEPDLSLIPVDVIQDDTNHQNEQLDYPSKSAILVDEIDPLSGSDMEETIKDELDILAVEPDEW